MNLRTLFVVSLAALAGAIVGESQGATAAAPDGLVSMRSARFHEFYVRPDAGLAGYRRVMIDPVQVEFRRNWQSDMNYWRTVPRRISDDETRQIAAETASDLEEIVAEVFRSHGYEIANAPGPGVLRLSLGVVDFYVNAPSARTTERTVTFTREAGGGTLHLEARDAVSDTILARGFARATTNVSRPLSLANTASNRFWLQGLFWRWATSCVAELEAGKARP